MLGTGNALVTKCYNTCFIIENENDYFMVDAGGGNTVLNQLEKAKINWKEIKHIFVTHKHIRSEEQRLNSSHESPSRMPSSA